MSNLATLKPFTSEYQPANRGRKKGSVSVVTELKKILEKKISYEDPETKQQVTGKIGHVIALRHILNACQGDHNAITDIMDRIDGKTTQTIPNVEINTYTNYWIAALTKAKAIDERGRITRVEA